MISLGLLSLNKAKIILFMERHFECIARVKENLLEQQRALLFQSNSKLYARWHDAGCKQKIRL